MEKKLNSLVILNIEANLLSVLNCSDLTGELSLPRKKVEKFK